GPAPVPARAPVAGPAYSIDAAPHGPAATPYGPNCWVGVEYLFFWVKKGPLPIPVALGGRAGSNGLFGTPGSQVLLGSTDFDYKQNSGVRVSAGWWFTDSHVVGLEANVFILPQRSTSIGPVFA